MPKVVGLEIQMVIGRTTFWSKAASQKGFTTQLLSSTRIVLKIKASKVRLIFIYTILSSLLHLLISNCFQMALIQVYQLPFESEVCGIKWWHFYNKIINK